MAKMATETDIKAEIQNALDKLGIPRWRMQAGGYRGRTRGLPKGTPDILAAPSIRMSFTSIDPWRPRTDEVPLFLWIEVKKPGEKPTKEQLDFAAKMTAQGHKWIVARSAEDVIGWLKENHAI